jgi:K+-sensing histidine kinase KdpD
MLRLDWQGWLLESVRPGPMLPRYGLALLAALAALCLRLLLLEPLASSSYLVYTPAIVLAGLLGGVGPGLLALLLCLVANWYFFLPPIESFGLDQPFAGEGMVVFLLIGGSLLLICQAVRTTIGSVADGDPRARSQLRQLIRRIRLRMEQ